MESFAAQIKRLRKEKGVPLRVVAAVLEIDQAILSKIENGKRIATRENIAKLAAYYNINEKDLTVSWLSDKLINEIDNEDLAIEAFRVAEEKIATRKTPQLSKEKIIEIIREFLKEDGRVAKAWIFGSFARGDYNNKSDIDMMVRFNNSDNISLFDYADLTFLLEEKLKKKIDLVEEGNLRPFALETAKNDLTLIYE
jgi:predicted nucleotidyltransferase/urease gamma subunit